MRLPNSRTVLEVAVVLQTSQARVLELIASKELPRSTQPGSIRPRWLVMNDVLEAFCNKHRPILAHTPKFVGEKQTNAFGYRRKAGQSLLVVEDRNHAALELRVLEIGNGIVRMAFGRGSTLELMVGQAIAWVVQAEAKNVSGQLERYSSSQDVDRLRSFDVNCWATMSAIGVFQSGYWTRPLKQRACNGQAALSSQRHNSRSPVAGHRLLTGNPLHGR